MFSTQKDRLLHLFFFKQRVAVIPLESLTINGFDLGTGQPQQP